MATYIVGSSDQGVVVREGLASIPVANLVAFIEFFKSLGKADKLFFSASMDFPETQNPVVLNLVTAINKFARQGSRSS